MSQIFSEFIQFIKSLICQDNAQGQIKELINFMNSETGYQRIGINECKTYNQIKLEQSRDIQQQVILNFSNKC